MMSASVHYHPGGASPYGVCEMAGNVKKWTADWYDGHLGSDYQCSAKGRTFKTLRDGSSFFTQNHAQSVYRCLTRLEGFGIDNVAEIGFRCVVDPE
jgi:formylglycine-generating enzyme required for sulfatase activity